jgi:hypothetical protein
MSRTPSSKPASDARPASAPPLEPVVELPDLIRTDGPRRGAVVRVALLVAGAVFFVLGIVGWLVPVVTGIPFYILSAICLGMASRRIARWVNKHERRLPYKFRRLLRKRHKPTPRSPPES